MPENIPLTDILSGGTNSLRTEITNTPAVTNANLNIQLINLLKKLLTSFICFNFIDYAKNNKI